jgi:hypothetical protein
MFVLSLLDHGRGLPYRVSIIDPIAKRFENLKLPETQELSDIEVFSASSIK